jgi:YidC/Oxa1 family membrane protein insertase
MAVLDPIAGPLLQAFGAVLAFLYGLIQSYGVAIILLTVLVRVLMLPLTLKQVRSMQEMQKLQPQLKELQRKYKGNRQKQMEETQKLYREHNVNPLGGCLPLVLQLPVFFALFAVLRATEGAYGIPAEAIDTQALRAEGTICLPDTSPTVDGPAPSSVVCELASGETIEYEIEEWRAKNSRVSIASPPSSVALCSPDLQDDQLAGFRCESVLGPGHLPENSELFAAIVEDRAQFLGIELACSPAQAANEENIRLCAGPGTRGGLVTAIPYFILMALMVATTYYQTKQMQAASSGPAAQQQQLMGRIMPIFLGFISYSISAGVLVYWVTTNAWQIGQQHLMLRSRPGQTTTVKGTVKDSTKPGSKSPDKPSTTDKSAKAIEGDGSKSKRSGGRSAGSRKKRRKR